MKIWLFLVIVLITSCSSTSFPEVLETKKQNIYSKNVKDSFELYITLPKNYTDSLSYPVVYYMDANLKSGKALRRVINEREIAGHSIQAIFIGIGHIGNYRVLRRRDLITPHLVAGDSLYSNEVNYGQVENFYAFLQKELIPYVEKRYAVSKQRTIIGHSFGGLFAFYCLFQQHQLFQNYVALSPSLWVNDENIYEFEKKFRKSGDTLNARLFVRAGGNETINKVLPACNKMNNFLSTNSYTGLKLDYKVLAGDNHNSHVENSLREIIGYLDQTRN